MVVGSQEALVGDAPASKGPAAMPTAEMLRALEARRGGLTQAEAGRRFARFGANEPGQHHRLPLMVLFAPVFNPLVLILLLSAGVSVFWAIPSARPSSR